MRYSPSFTKEFIKTKQNLSTEKCIWARSDLIPIFLSKTSFRNDGSLCYGTVLLPWILLRTHIFYVKRSSEIVLSTWTADVLSKWWVFLARMNCNASIPPPWSPRGGGHETYLTRPPNVTDSYTFQARVRWWTSCRNGYRKSPRMHRSSYNRLKTSTFTRPVLALHTWLTRTPFHHRSRAFCES